MVPSVQQTNSMYCWKLPMWGFRSSTCNGLYKVDGSHSYVWHNGDGGYSVEAIELINEIIPAATKASSRYFLDSFKQ
ncbi:hypothetical protein ACTXT7_016954, partial [Hymenolepis weldensis]